MNEKRFKSTLDEDTMSIMPYLVSDNEECFYNLDEIVDLLNEQQSKIQILREEIQSTVYILKMQTRKLEGY